MIYVCQESFIGLLFQSRRIYRFADVLVILDYSPPQGKLVVSAMDNKWKIHDNRIKMMYFLAKQWQNAISIQCNLNYLVLKYAYKAK